MKNISDYRGQQGKIVLVFEPFIKDDGSGQGYTTGYHVDAEIANLEVCDELLRWYGIQFGDGEIFLLDAKRTTSIEISDRKQEILLTAEERARDHLESIRKKIMGF